MSEKLDRWEQMYKEMYEAGLAVSRTGESRIDGDSLVGTRKRQGGGREDFRVELASREVKKKPVKTKDGKIKTRVVLQSKKGPIADVSSDDSHTESVKRVKKDREVYITDDGDED